ncbi:MAG: lysophospholipid acyltransferase family protein [Sulfurospirillaceae bacterium]|nr:lysophospholipid acyltransferase family protein [Sulfurospirillaceae bacterium]
MTCKKRIHSNTALDKLPSPLIVAFWHGEILATMGLYQICKKNMNIDFLISEHKDGEIIARTIALFGEGSIRGSSTRGGIKALRQAFKAIEMGKNIGITPDGPRGPRHSVADGIVIVSQRKQVPIMTLNFQPSSFWQIKSWDKFVIPKPFSTVDFYLGDSFLVDDLLMDDAKNIIKERLMVHAV